MPGIPQWEVVGALSAEERCMTVPQELAAVGKLGRCTLVRVHDLPDPMEASVRRAMNARETQLTAQLGGLLEFHDDDLMSDIPELTELAAYVDGRIGAKVILDISCLPKRFFFSTWFVTYSRRRR
jgi:hypothetical protein